jgi:Cytotoxic
MPQKTWVVAERVSAYSTELCNEISVLCERLSTLYKPSYSRRVHRRIAADIAQRAGGGAAVVTGPLYRSQRGRNGRTIKVSGGRGGRSGAHQPVAPPKVLPGFPGATRVPPKAFPGHKPRTRWVLQDGTFLEFDRRHGTLERFDRRGNHLGEYDIDGNLLKPANPMYSAVP